MEIWKSQRLSPLSRKKEKAMEELSSPFIKIEIGAEG